ncbi:hypothetical protein CEW92_16545 [Bacillaceae bacterium SAS-127]|nr:hypothetical protein CEW92_16545 [Bacillaceae bacterium SAS-127]
MLQNNTTASNMRWKARDFITLAIFNIAMIIILSIAITVSSVFSESIGGGLGALLTGPVYIIMANKINKKGVLFFSSTILGLFFIAMGMLQYLPVYIFFGILSEWAMRGKDSYRNTFRNAIGYSVYYLGFCFSGVFPLMFFKEQYIATLEAYYSPEAMTNMIRLYETPSIVLFMCVLSVIGAFLGCYFGERLFKKHIQKARLV